MTIHDVEAMYTFEVWVLSYQNPTSQRADGRCCDGMGNNKRNNQCDNIFTFCLRNSGHPRDDNTVPENCPLGMYNTGQFEDQDIITFSTPSIDQEADVPNPLVFTGAVWPVSHLNISHCQTVLVPQICIIIYTVHIV